MIHTLGLAAALLVSLPEAAGIKLTTFTRVSRLNNCFNLYAGAYAQHSGKMYVEPAPRTTSRDTMPDFSSEIVEESMIRFTLSTVVRFLICRSCCVQSSSLLPPLLIAVEM